jgi:thiosulfate dehydrogenase [quinone] large subunit
MTPASRRTTITKTPLRPDAGRRMMRRYRQRSLADGWLEMPWAIRILRAFLGATFLFAGIQKFLDPNFLRHGGGDYIGTQLAGFADGTPAAPLMRFLEHAPLVAGVGIAVLEIAVGLGTLLGIAMLSASFIGFAINVTLWLSATWHTHPYFLGSDSVYAVAWLVLAVAIVELEHAERGHVAGPIERLDGISRREFARGSLVAGIAVALGVAAKAVAAPASSSGLAGLADRTRPSSSGGAATSASSSSPSSTAGPPAAPTTQGRVLTSLDRLPVGGAVGFTDPQVGPAALLRPSTDEVVAYGRTCTHAGCLVGYDQNARILVCPCHGAEFDPSNHADPIAGPAPTPLPAIRVVVDKATGDVILPP